jgi:hypothetical protein
MSKFRSVFSWKVNACTQGCLALNRGRDCFACTKSAAGQMATIWTTGCRQNARCSRRHALRVPLDPPAGRSQLRGGEMRPERMLGWRHGAEDRRRANCLGGARLFVALD